MGFNKRYFNINMLLARYTNDRENGISKAIGKTDCFIYEDDISHNIIKLWMNNNKEEARKILDKCTLNPYLG